MSVFVTRNVADFAERTAGFLMSRPVKHNVLATVTARLEATDPTEAPVFAWIEVDGEVSGAALRTPPRCLVVSTMSEEAADELIPRLLELDPALPGVNGPQPAVSYLARAWRRHTGGTVATGMSQAILALADVTEPARQPPGRARPAEGRDRDLLVEWMCAFVRDAGVPTGDEESSTERRLRAGRMFVWDHERIVSMAGTGPPVAGVVRLGPVYTRPEARRHGYATALVAQVSRRVLSAGATKCMLHTDLANPTSNAIYEAVGYRRLGDAQEYHFDGA